jgi:hypothetical protein
MTADLDLDVLAALEQAATPGPWATDGVQMVVETGIYLTRADAALIAALRNAAPALIAAARELQRRVTCSCAAGRGVMDCEVRARDAARAELADLRERVEAALDPSPRDFASWPPLRDRIRAALATGSDRG